MKQLTGLTAGVFALAAAYVGTAAADGMPRRAAPPPPPPVVQERCAAGPWTGFYVGGNLGWAHHENEFKDHDKFFSDKNRFGDEDDGFTIGVQSGYNLQCGNVVFGVESDINWVGIDNNNKHDGWGYGYDDFRRDRSVDWFSTFRGRIGWTNDRIMVFATGGVAFTSIDGDFRGTGHYEWGPHWDRRTAYANHKGSHNSEWGWVAGGGIEWLHSPNWTFKAEALWIDFDNDSRKDTVRFDKGECAYNCEGYKRYVDKDARFSFDDQMVVVRFGMNYKFGDRTPVYEPMK